MKSFNSGLIILSSVGLLFLGACSKEATTSNQSSSPAASPTTSSSPATSTEETSAKSDHSKSSKGGQVVESGAYHLEFVPERKIT